MSRSRWTAVLTASLLLATLLIAAAPAAFAAPAPVSARVGSHTFIGTGASDAVAQALGVPVKASIVSTSTNWSGYAVQTAFETGADNEFSDVKGTWVVPTVTVSTDDAYSANWVGIDGYSSSTVEQLGTESDSIGGAAFYGAWWEMYPGDSFTITSLTIHPGDVMTAEVKWISGNKFQLSMTDVTTGKTFTTTQTQTQTAHRSSAEWIVEAPSGASGVLPFPEVTSSLFTACTAVGNSVTGPINGSGWQYNAMTLADSSDNALQVPSALTASGTSFVMSKPNADVTPPVTHSDAVATYSDSALIHLTATDNVGGSGVASTFHQLDGGPVTTGTSVSVATYGSHTLRFWSIDNAGNIETANAVTFFVNDTIAPTTTSNAVASYAGTATITLTATDNTGGSGVASTHYSVDGAVLVAGTHVTVTGIGGHTLAFFSTDVAGNQEATKTVGFNVTAPPPPDTTPPTTTSDAVASYDNVAVIHLTATDNVGGSGVASTHYSVDGAAFVVGSTVTVTSVGTHTLAFYSTDVAGNQEATNQVTFAIVAVGPQPSRLSKSPSSSGLVVVRHHGVANLTFSATLESSAGVPIGGEPVVLQRSANGVAWTNVATRSTNGSGAVSVALVFKGAGVGYWRWLFTGDSSWAAASTSRTTITVR